MAATLNKDANITKSNSDINEEILFGAPSTGPFLMDVSVDGHAELIQELTDASRDKGAYAIREAISNAFDATLKAGDPTRPVEVTIPDRVSGVARDTDSLARKMNILGDDRHYASITDHGIGMTADELRENFAQYGNSDKRGSGAIGSKGLGSKAPLACADFFEVISTKGGITTTMLLWREDGGNYAKVVSEKRTRKESGTTVRIPVTSEDTRSQMERQLTLIAGWNIRFNLVAKVGTTDLRTNRLGTEVGNVYTVTMGFGKPSHFWHDTKMAPSTETFIYMGKVAIGQSSDGEDVIVDMWRNYDSIRGDINDPDGFRDGASIDINLMGVRYPLLRDGAVGSSDDMSSSHVDYIIGCEPGYLNFTVSRDDIKEDDAWRLFVSSLREGIAKFDQRPVVVSHVTGMRDAQGRYTFLRRRNIKFSHDGSTYTVAGLPLTDAQAHALFTVTNRKTGEVTDMTDLMFCHENDEAGPIRVLVNDSGTMHGIGTKASSNTSYWMRQSVSGYHYGSNYRLNPKEIRYALDDAAARQDCAALLVAVGDKYYSESSSCTDLNVVILTNMGEGCRRIATADKSIRKYVCEQSKRPQDVSMAYVLCEGDYKPSEAEKVILNWFKSWSIAKFDDYMKECKSGVLLREKKAAEKRKRDEERARRSQTYYLSVTTCSPWSSRKSVLEDIADGGILKDKPFTSEYVNPYQMGEGDIVAIRCGWNDNSREAIRIAWMLLEATGITANANGDRHTSLYIMSTDEARNMGLYDMGTSRHFDVLYDETGQLDGLLPKGITFDSQGNIYGKETDFGITRRSPELIAAMLRCDNDLCRCAVGGFFRIAGTTGNSALDSVITETNLDSKWVKERSYSRRYAIHITPSDKMRQHYRSIRDTAEHLTHLWHKGVGQIADGALHSNPNQRHLPGSMRYETLQKAMAALV